MGIIWHSLAWKEWHEHAWKLVAVAAVLCGVNLLFLPRDDALPGDYMMTLLSAVPLAVFLGASVATSERSRGTMPFLEALPIPLWKVASHKLLYGLATLIVAISLTFLFVYCWFSWRVDHATAESFLAKAWEFFPPQVRIGNWFLSCAVTISLVAGSIFLWTAVAGANGTDEVGAGARGMLAMVGWWTLLVVFGRNLDQWWFDTHKTLVATLIAASPGGAAVMVPKLGTLTSWAGTPLPIFVGLGTHLALVFAFILRFGRTTSPWFASQSVSDAGRRAVCLRRPWRSKFTAIAWKQFRECGPVVATGLAGAAGCTVLYLLSQWGEVWRRPVGIVECYIGMTAMFGFLVTLVVGIGTSLTDLNPKLNTFWRSRPIDPNLWYWTKFISGALLLFSLLFVPTSLLLWLSIGRGDISVSDELLAFLAGYLAVYIAAVTVTCLVRHAVYSAILSLAAAYAGFCAAWLFQLVVRWTVWHEPQNWWRDDTPSRPLLVAGLVAISIAAVLLGWQAVRNDWGRKA
jgi:hypothetical protein